MKNSMRRAMISTVCMLIVAVMSLTGVTYAWFTAGTQAQISGMEMTVTSAAGGIEIKEGEGAWQTQLNWDFSNKKNINPVSTVDAVDFFSATINTLNTAQIKTTAITRDSSNDIIVKTIKVRNTGTQQIVVTLDGSTVTNKGIDTDILNAARVAVIVNYPDTMIDSENITYIWAGDSDTQTYYGIDSATPLKGSVEQESTADQAAVTRAEDVYINANEFVEGYTVAVTPVTPDGCSITLPGNANGSEGGYTEVEVTIVVWVEGQDPDCKNSNAGGGFEIALNIKAND